MAKYGTYDLSKYSPAGYHWTGINTLNMFGSVVVLTEPIYARQISVYWGGYGGVAYGNHCIWRKSDAKLMVRSGTVTAQQGSLSRGSQQWIDAYIPETYLEPGEYFVGVWCNPNYRRVWTQWNYGIYSTLDYLAQNLYSSDYFSDWFPNESDSTGVLGAYIEGEPAARVSVNVLGSWKKGSLFVKVGTDWKKSKGIYVNVLGTWRRSK